MNQKIYERLLSVARDQNRGYTTYSEISPLADLDMENPADRDTMSRLLEQIARHEQDAGRPMLTAVWSFTKQIIFREKVFLRWLQNLAASMARRKFDVGLMPSMKFMNTGKPDNGTRITE